VEKAREESSDMGERRFAVEGTFSAVTFCGMGTAWAGGASCEMEDRGKMKVARARCWDGCLSLVKLPVVVGSNLTLFDVSGGGSSLICHLQAVLSESSNVLPPSRSLVASTLPFSERVAASKRLSWSKPT